MAGMKTDDFLSDLITSASAVRCWPRAPIHLSHAVPPERGMIKRKTHSENLVALRFVSLFFVFWKGKIQGEEAGFESSVCRISCLRCALTSPESQTAHLWDGGGDDVGLPGLFLGWGTTFVTLVTLLRNAGSVRERFFHLLHFLLSTLAACVTARRWVWRGCHSQVLCLLPSST